MQGKAVGSVAAAVPKFIQRFFRGNHQLGLGSGALLGVAVLTACGFSLEAAPAPVQAAAEPAQASSYAEVAPIFQRRCAACHNPHGGAPFNLLTYADAKQWGEQILEVTQNRYMPPWLPAPGRGDFIGERRLPDPELAAIRRWVGSGMPEGAAGAGHAAGAANAPAEPTAPPAWKLGKPDLTLELPQPVELPGSGSDQFLNLILPYTGAPSRPIRAIEIRASVPQAVRTIWLQFDAGGVMRKAHPDDWKGGIPGEEPAHDLEPKLQTGGHLLLWTPDAPVLTAPSGPVWQPAPNADMVLTTHLKTTGHAEKLQLTIALYYGKAGGSAASASETIELEKDSAIHIPAGGRPTLTGQFTVPDALRVTAIYPRAHSLGKQLDAYATLPGGKKVWLVSIPRWDVDWQGVYRFRAPVALPKGAVVHWEYTYDNSGDNPRNPNDPPAEVNGGASPKEETGALWLEVLPSAAGGATAAWKGRLHTAAAAATVTMGSSSSTTGR